MAVERDAKGWPILHAAQDFECDGRHPASGQPCLMGDHRGHHRDEFGAEWLDGDEWPMPRGSGVIALPDTQWADLGSGAGYDPRD